MEHALAYRAATADDVKWLADTFIRSLGSAIKEERGYWDETKERDQFLRQLRLSDTSVLVLEGSPVGFYTAWFEPDHLFLGTLCVIPECQNRRFGTRAMCSIAKRSTNLPVRLSVLKSNRAARRFYERLGCRYVSSSEHHDHFIWPGNAMHATCENARA